MSLIRYMYLMRQLVERNFWLVKSPSKMQQNMTDLWLLQTMQRNKWKWWQMNDLWYWQTVLKSLSAVIFILKRILKVQKFSDEYCVYWLMNKNWVRVQTTKELLKCFSNSIKENLQILLLVTKDGCTIWTSKKNRKQNMAN